MLVKFLCKYFFFSNHQVSTHTPEIPFFKTHWTRTEEEKDDAIRILKKEVKKIAKIPNKEYYELVGRDIADECLEPIVPLKLLS